MENKRETIQDLDIDFLVKFLQEIKYTPINGEYAAKLSDKEIYNIHFLIEYKVIKIKKMDIIKGNFLAEGIFRDPIADLLLEALMEEQDETKWQKTKKKLGTKISKALEIGLNIGTQVAVTAISKTIT